MAITKPTRKPAASTNQQADEFISGAPDSQSKAKGVRKGNRQQISLTIAPDLLNKVDELAAKMGQSRAAVINMAIYKAVEEG